MPTLIDGGWSVSGSSVRPSASAHWPTSTSFFGNAAGTGRSFASIFSERQHPRLVGGDDLGDEPLRPAGDGDEDVGRLVGEVEGTGDDVARPGRR